MGYPETLQQLSALRGLDQASLAQALGLSKSTVSRILNGAQEPKLSLAVDLAKVLGVTLDALVTDMPESGPCEQLVPVSEDEVTILKIVRQLGVETSMNRLLNVPAPAGSEWKPGNGLTRGTDPAG